MSRLQSPGTSEMASSRISPARICRASPPPLMDESLRRTVLISAMLAPEASRLRVTPCLSASVTPGTGWTSSADAPPDSSTMQRSAGAQAPRQLKDARPGGDTGRIGNRMSRLEDLDARRLLAGPQAMAIASHHRAADGPELVRVVMGRQGCRHAGSSLARTEHQRPAGRACRRQKRGQAVRGIGRGETGAEQPGQQLTFGRAHAVAPHAAGRSTATAGSTVPSRNSRNAPPPVET